MFELRWLTRHWEEMHESGFKPKSERVLQYRCKVPTPMVDIIDANMSEWEDVPEELETLL